MDGGPTPRNHNMIRTVVVTTSEQLLHAFAIRAICYMEEHGVKAQQTFDGNDYQATHFICYDDKEPIGTLRIRWFKDFAKFERTSFRVAWRNLRTLKSFSRVVFDHVARKGYSRVITHAQPKYARLWCMAFGFKTVEGKSPLYFEGHEEPYTELVKELQIPENVITEQSEPAVLFRIEGFWDEPSEYETVAV